MCERRSSAKNDIDRTVKTPGENTRTTNDVLNGIAQGLLGAVSQLNAIFDASPLIDDINVHARLKWIMKMRYRRGRQFGAELFADPAWDILLDLTLARLEGRRTPVSSLCIASNVPTTTALRWIKVMQDKGMIERKADPLDSRRSFVDICEPVFQTMLAFLAQP